MQLPLALIIDDEPDVTQFLSDCVSKMGFQCIVAFCIEDTLKIIADKKLALVIVDIFMPGIGGIEGIRQIRNQNEKCKILAVSGGFGNVTGEVALKAAVKIGADAILPKPMRINEIRNAVNSLIGM